MRSMGRMGKLFIAVLAIGVVGALSDPASTTGRTSSPTSSPVVLAPGSEVSAPVVQVAPGQTQKMIATEKYKYDASRKIAEIAINKAEYFMNANLKYEPLKARVKPSLILAKDKLSLADEAAKAEKWSEAGGYLIFAHDRAIQAQQRASVLAGFFSQISDLYFQVEWQRKNLDKVKARIDLAEKAVNEAVVALGAADSPNSLSLVPAKIAVDAAQVHCYDAKSNMSLF